MHSLFEDHSIIWCHVQEQLISPDVMPEFLQILVELAELQDQEVGDGTTSVVIVAAELLKRANELVRNRIHPTSIIGGYRIAMREVGLPPTFTSLRPSQATLRR